MRHLSLECRFEAWFFDFRMQIQRQNVNAKANAYENGFWCPKCEHLSLECSFDAWFFDFRMQVQRQMQMSKAHRKMVFDALNAAFISLMPLWSVIFWFQNANTKANANGKGKCIGKWFLCPKCAIYLLNLECRFEAWFVDFRRQIQRQNANAKANA